VSTDTLTCPSCGSEVPNSALLCPQCGRPNVSTAFAGTYSTPQSPQPQPGVGLAAQPPAPAPSSLAGDTEGQHWSNGTPGPASAREDASNPTSSLPESLRPGSFYAAPTNKPQEPNQPPIAAPNPTPRSSTPALDGRSPGPQPTYRPRQDQGQPMYVRPRAPFDLNQRPQQSQPGYGLWDQNQASYDRSRGQSGRGTPGTTRIDPNVAIAVGVFLTIIGAFFLLDLMLGSPGAGLNIACFLAVLGFVAVLWQASKASGRRR